MKHAGGTITASRRIDVFGYMWAVSLFDFGWLVKFNLFIFVYVDPAGTFQTSKLVLNRISLFLCDVILNFRKKAVL